MVNLILNFKEVFPHRPRSSRLPHLALACGGCLPLLVLILGVFFALPVLLLEATVGQLTRFKAGLASSCLEIRLPDNLVQSFGSFTIQDLHEPFSSRALRAATFLRSGPVRALERMVTLGQGLGLAMSLLSWVTTAMTKHQLI